MDQGKFSTVLREKVKHFNGKFFKDKTALPLNHDQVELLVEAAQYHWDDVEPAIFGTLLERALDPVERHKLGAHYTPRAYVERLVMPTVIEPLREQWDATYAAANQLHEEKKTIEARKLLRSFHDQLCETRVLDPACGSGNFLYVSMELMKRLEGEVLNTMREFDDRVLPSLTIDPHQFLGIEVNPRAAALAELVLWIGSIQWYRRTRDSIDIAEPILRDYGNIQCRDAVLAWDSIEPVVDEKTGQPVTRWDGRSTKPHPVTGEEVPDETARVQEVRYINPRKAEWPQTDYIVGNPPFIGQQRMRFLLGDGYVDAVRLAWQELPETIDFVFYWWRKAADLVGAGEVCRFGFVTTNSIVQPLNRRVVLDALESSSSVSIVFAIPDHPWEDQGEQKGAADVRVAMTVCIRESSLGKLYIHDSDRRSSRSGVRSGEFTVVSGKINADLTCGVTFDSCKELQSNDGIAIKGFELGSQGFLVAKEIAEQWIHLDSNLRQVVHPYMNGDDLKEGKCWRSVIDFFGMNREQAMSFGLAFQYVTDNVRAHRESNRESRTAANWWLWRRSGQKLRDAIILLSRFIGTTRTSKHRVFQFCPGSLRAESKIVVIATEDADILGLLSAKIHVVFSNRIGGWLGVGNDPTYNHSDCFNKFPFPVTDEATKKRIGDLAEQLDAHRKRQQEHHPTLTMTGMYNVLEKLRSGEKLTAKEQTIHEQGLVSVLKQIHDDLDAAVFDAYGWPHDLEDEEILQRLVDLNHQRAEEESRGLIRWLRPEFQNPQGTTQTTFASDEDPEQPKKTIATKVTKQPWPKTLPERMVAIQSALQRHAAPATPKEIAAYYTRANESQVTELLQTLVAVGNLRQLPDARFTTYK
jgi:hypothetical protein